MTNKRIQTIIYIQWTRDNKQMKEMKN